MSKVRANEIVSLDGVGSPSFPNKIRYEDFPSGVIIQHQQVVKTDAEQIANIPQGGLSADVSNLILNITPLFVNSKIKISGHISGHAGGSLWYATLYRNGVPILQGNSAGSRQRVSIQGLGGGGGGNGATYPFVFIDSPNTVSPCTYSIRVSHSVVGTSNVFINRTELDSDNNFQGRLTSVIIAEEIKQ